jgi:hypothetical protein
MTADRTANNNELHAHKNPLNITFPKHLSPVDLEVYEAAVEELNHSFLPKNTILKKPSRTPFLPESF